MTSHSSLIVCCAFIVIGSAAGAAPPPVTVSWSIDGADAQTIEIEGTGATPGLGSYSTSVAAEGGACTLNLLMNADYLVDLQSNVNGQITLINNSDEPRDILFEFDVPICPGIDGPSNFGVLAIMTLDTEGAGSLVCIDDGIFSVTEDGALLKSLFTCPYQMATTGSGTLTVTGQYGTPGASAAGPSDAASQGARVRCMLSSLDTLTITFTYNLKDLDGIGPGPCPGDLNHDGTVNGQDITVFLAQWQMPSECPSPLEGDVNGDGLVDGQDLTIILAGWGACGE